MDSGPQNYDAEGTGSEDRFPPELVRDSKTTVTLDPARLLLGLKNPIEIDAFASRLRGLGLTLEGDPRNRDSSIAPHVNHTTRRYWIRSLSGDAVRKNIIRAAEDQFGDNVDWIAPVYVYPGEIGLSGRHCPLPDALLIKEPIEHPSLLEDTERSRYMICYRYYRVVDPTTSAYELRDQLLNDGNHTVDGVQFDTMPMASPYSYEPLDTFYKANPPYQGQWNMVKVDAGGPGVTAWDWARGNPDVKIAVIDSGCDLTHPDLTYAAGKTWDSSPGIGEENPATTFSPRGHGTMVAGVAAATTDSLKGVSGMAGLCKIIPIGLTTVSDSEIMNAIMFASYSGARVINMSFRVLPSILIDAQIEGSHNYYNVLFCASAGNGDKPWDLDKSTGKPETDYPAKNKYVMAVGATDQNDHRTSWSNFESAISVMAPGTAIPTTTVRGTGDMGEVGNDYVSSFRGTSAAAPHVAGLAALLFSWNASLTNVKVREIIESTADKVGNAYDVKTYTELGLNGKWSRMMGYGRINAYDAVIRAVSLSWPLRSSAGPVIAPKSSVSHEPIPPMLAERLERAIQAHETVLADGVASATLEELHRTLVALGRNERVRLLVREVMGSRAFQDLLRRDRDTALATFGLDLPKNVAVRLVDLDGDQPTAIVRFSVTAGRLTADADWHPRHGVSTCVRREP
ncbi:S8 family serine peptidase [Nocardia fusca]|uniref:S8 family serine peptidase n=1 Tax=Nocardia fusca TaxID=941183 RepID=UPI000A011968|nr:S8 family serine peptidase [Nocardia fusca]